MIKQDMEAEILRRLDSKEPISSIAREMGISRGTVYRVKDNPRDTLESKFRHIELEPGKTLRESIISGVPSPSQYRAVALIALDVIELNELNVIDHPLLRFLAQRAEQALKGKNYGSDDA